MYKKAQILASGGTPLFQVVQKFAFGKHYANLLDYMVFSCFQLKAEAHIYLKVLSLA